MANNFKFLFNRIKDKIHLKLYGDFDGSSAFELITILKKYNSASNQIVIDTNNLNTIYPFGINVFKRNISVMDIKIDNIIITGKKRFSLQQRWCWLNFTDIDFGHQLFARCWLNNKERFALAERVQKRIQEGQPHFWLTKRRDEISKELEVKKENRWFWTINKNRETEKQI